MSAARASLVGVAVAAALSVAGCKTETATTARSIQSLSPQTVALMSEKGMSKADPMLLRIYKEEAKAEVWKKRRADGKYALLKSYDICRFSGKLGPKIKEGDKQAPEGFYSVTPAQMNPKSSYYLSFNIGFPNKYDQALGRTGRHVMMHGDCLSAGCYAMTDAQIAEIYSLARESFAGGQKAFQVQAMPFRMTPENMARRRNDPNIAFWKNLKEGSDNFEVTKLEPKVDACGKKYVFNASTGPLSTIEPTAGCPALTVQPEIAKAVAAKQRADNAVIAQLTKAIPPAPEYVAQNGRMRRSLDEPIIQVAAVTPTPAFAAEGGPSAAAMGQTMGAPGPIATGSASTVALRTAAPAPASGLQLASAPSAAAPAPAMKTEGGLFTRMFRSEEPAPAVAQAAHAAAPAAVAAPAPRAVASAHPARREIAPQQPVMASSFAPAPAQKPAESRSGIGGWVKSVGGLFGGSSEPVAAPAGEPLTLSPSPVSQPTTVAPKPRERSARMPAEFKPQAKLDPRVTSAFAAFE